MKFIRRTAEYSLLKRRRHEDILKLTTDPDEMKLEQYKQNWL